MDPKRKVLVTGAARGIGAACSRKLAQAGYHVIVHYHQSEAPARQVLAMITALGGSAELICFDASDEAEVARVLTAWLEANGPLQALVLNAGIRADAPLAMMFSAEWHQVLSVNLDSFFYLTKPIIQGMLHTRTGKIVAITSLSGVTGMPGQVNYSASKAGVIGAVKALAREVGKRKINVNAVAPGFIATDMLAGLDPRKLTEHIPLGRVGTAEEVANVVAFLLSADADYITGQVIEINGGLHL